MAWKDPITKVTNPEPKEWTAARFSKLKIADYKPYNFVDGEGVRCSIYVSGCPFACPGCYNKAIQSFDYGVDYTEELEEQIIKDLSAPYCQGLTLLGGEPMLNTQVLLQLCQRVRDTFANQKDIWAWTGYTWEELQEESDDKLALLDLIDVLVDGRYLAAQRDLTLRFRGSANQRIIDVKASQKSGKIVLWEDEFENS